MNKHVKEKQMQIKLFNDSIYSSVNQCVTLLMVESGCKISEVESLVDSKKDLIVIRAGRLSYTIVINRQKHDFSIRKHKQTLSIEDKTNEAL